MKDLVTTLLDLLGLLLLAFGAAAALFPLMGWASVSAAGVVIIVGSKVAVWAEDPATAPPWLRPALTRWVGAAR